MILMHCFLTQEARIEQKAQKLANMNVKQNFETNFAWNRGPKKGNESVGSYGYTFGYGNNGNFGNNGYKRGYTSSGFTSNAFRSNPQFRGFQGDNQK